MNKIIISILNQVLIIFSFIAFFVFSRFSTETKAVHPSGVGWTTTYSAHLNLVPLGFLIVVLVINYFVFKKYQLPTKHFPFIFTSCDEREQKIMDESAASLFYTFLPFFTAICAVSIFMVMVIHITTTSEINQNLMVRVFGIVLTLMVAIPSLIHNIMVFIKTNRV